MSTDDPLERAAVYGSHVGEALAKQHGQDAQNVLPVYAENTCVTIDTRHAMTMAMWAAYLTVIVTHIAIVIGPKATSGLLRDISAAHEGLHHAH